MAHDDGARGCPVLMEHVFSRSCKARDCGGTLYTYWAMACWARPFQHDQDACETLFGSSAVGSRRSGWFVYLVMLNVESAE